MVSRATLTVLTTKVRAKERYRQPVAEEVQLCWVSAGEAVVAKQPKRICTVQA